MLALKDASPAGPPGGGGALGPISDARGVEPLRGVLKDEDAGVRVAAVRSLTALKNGGAVGAILALLQDASADVRDAATEALAVLAPDRVIEGLVRTQRQGRCHPPQGRADPCAL